MLLHLGDFLPQQFDQLGLVGQTGGFVVCGQVLHLTQQRLRVGSTGGHPLGQLVFKAAAQQIEIGRQQCVKGQRQKVM